jgi:23S rRNA (cytidine2498-2'-O)-methyltransferase
MTTISIQPLDQLHEVIVTTSADSRPLAIGELKPVYRATISLNETTFLAKLSVSFAELAGKFQAAPPIFIQHICPPQLRVSLKNKAEADLAQLAEAARLLRQTTPPLEPSFSVQTRILDRPAQRPYRPFNVNQKLADLLAGEGDMLDVQNPAWVLSVVIAANVAYLGLSSARQNLSNWAGGQRRFKQELEQISRSEFKLLEAIDVFNIELPPPGTALDLGAAPGGWTRLLRRWGYEVYAVDPAWLAPQLHEDAKVHHFRESARQFLARGLTYNLIVNDMRLNVVDSANLMVEAAQKLAKRGMAIMTLKLPKRDSRQRVELGLKILQKAYQILGVRQLFHNRNEVTVVMRKK